MHTLVPSRDTSNPTYSLIVALSLALKRRGRDALLGPRTAGEQVSAITACTHKIADRDSDLMVRFDALCGLKSGISQGPGTAKTGHKPSSSTSPSMLSKRHNEVKSIISFDFNRESFAAINARISSAI
jgi:hypothetical protein